MPEIKKIDLHTQTFPAAGFTPQTGQQQQEGQDFLWTMKHSLALKKVQEGKTGNDVTKEYRISNHETQV